MKTRRKPTQLGKDKRRKHRHFDATIFYRDGEVFARRYTDQKKAAEFAKRQRRSPVVKTARVIEIN